MVVNKIDIMGVTLLHHKNDAPVSTYGYGPISLEVTFQRMEVKAGKVHMFRCSDAIQSNKDMFKLLDILRGDFPAVVRLKKPFQSTMFKTSYHRMIVYSIYAITEFGD